MSPQLICGDTGQAWKWFEGSNKWFYNIRNIHNGEINEQRLEIPTLIVWSYIVISTMQTFATWGTGSQNVLQKWVSK